MTFSVIVPVYNVENYLRECLDSIINQTYGDLEIICIDDGSTDTSGKILDEYARVDKRIIVVHKANSGYGQTMNLGLSKASGEYIGIVESDDYIALDAFERFAKIVEESKVRPDIVKCSYTCLAKDEKRHRKLFNDEMCGKVIVPTEYMSLFRVPCSIWSAVYNRMFLLDNGIDFLETPGASYQDMSFTFKAFIMAKALYLSNESVYFYRIFNIDSSVNSGKKIFCVCDEMKEIDAFVQKNNICSPFAVNAKYVFMHQSYWWNYYRLYGGRRYIFYLKMVEEFRNMFRNSYFDGNYFDEDSLNRIQKILADSERYFLECNPYFKQYYEENELDEYTLKESLYQEALRRYFDTECQFIIYGAGVYGKAILDYFKKCGFEKSIIGFAVTDRTSTSRMIEGVPVFEIHDLIDKYGEATIIVAVKTETQLMMLRNLKKLGFRKILRVDGPFLKIMRQAVQSGI